MIGSLSHMLVTRSVGLNTAPMQVPSKDKSNPYDKEFCGVLLGELSSSNPAEISAVCVYVLGDPSFANAALKKQTVSTMEKWLSDMHKEVIYQLALFAFASARPKKVNCAACGGSKKLNDGSACSMCSTTDGKRYLHGYLTHRESLVLANQLLVEKGEEPFSDYRWRQAKPSFDQAVATMAILSSSGDSLIRKAMKD